jgi:hypothetical protein
VSNSGERSSAIHTAGGAKKLLMRWRSISGSRFCGVGFAVITLRAPT